MSADSPFGMALKRHRKALDLTQEELAWRAGCAVETLRKLEQGKRRPSRELATRLAQELGIPEVARPAFVRQARTGPSEALPTQALPAPLSPLIGRTRELSEVKEALESDSVRLLTVIGAPGIGKTRLCLQAATEVAARFPDGARFVGLAPIRNPALVLPAVARALGIDERFDRPLSERLRDYLQDKHLLLLLDNCEHLPSAAPLIGELLTGAAGLKVLASSRTPLRVYGEHEYLLAPLAYPAPGAPLSVAALSGYGAVQLFVARAQAVQQDFRLSPENAGVVAAICRQLDGLPLALELAATRAKLFTPQALLERLDDRLGLLTGGAADLPERQRALRGAIAWSYDLLSASEQALFRQLGVFTGTFALSAAEAVAGDPQTGANIATLLDHSLLQRLPDASGAARFGMLETLQEYARERLAEHPEEAARTAAAHQRWYLGRLAAPPEPQSKATLEELERDLPNIRSAWRQAASTANVALLAASLAPLQAFLTLRGRLQEGYELCDAALQTLGAPRETGARDVEDGAREDGARDVGTLAGRCLIAKAFFASRLGRIDEAHDLAQTGVAALGAAGGHPDVARGLTVMGYAAKFRGDYAQAAQHLKAAATLAREHEDRAVMADSLADLANTRQLLGDYEAAQNYAETAQLLYRNLNDHGGLVWSFAYLGLVHLRRGALTEARRALAQAQQLAEASGERFWLALVLAQFGLLAHAHGHHALAEQRLLEALETARESGEAGLQAWLLSDLGRVNLALQDPTAAEQHFRQALHLATELRWPAPTLSALMGFALLHRSDARRAAPLADLVYRHPATEHLHREMARNLLDALGAPLPDTRDPSGLSQAIVALLEPQAP